MLRRRIKDNNRIRAFYYLDELMDEYPASALYQIALQKQFDIASEYLNGYCDLLSWPGDFG